MSEKICSTCQCNKVCDHNKYGFENCGNYISAVLAQRAEAAQEIFEEISGIIQRNTQYDIRNGLLCVSGYNGKQIARLIYELKEKYTEEGK